MRLHAKLSVAAAALAAPLLTFAGPAQAASQRFAAPTGSGTACTQAAPCSLRMALGNEPSPTPPQTGDDVAVAAGDYGSAATPLPPAVGPAVPMNIRGDASGARPRIFVPTSGFQMGSSSTLQYVEIRGAGSTALSAFDMVTIDQVVAVGAGNNATACNIPGGATGTILRDSVCHATGTNSNGLNAGNNAAGSFRITVTNVTAVGTRDGFEAVGSGGGTTVTMHNTIAYGGGTYDAEIAIFSAGQTATVEGSNNNFNSTRIFGAGAAGGSFNDTAPQTDPPVFADGPNGDFHQATSSPTRDAGTPSAGSLGTVDLDGTPRITGPAPDIGADEFAAPGAAPRAARDVTQTSATLAGDVNPAGKATSYRFEWGTTSAFGNSTDAASAGKGVGATEVTAAIAGLSPGTTYHYRLVATNASGTVTSAESTFVTGAAATPSSGGGPSVVPPPAFSGAGLPGATRLRVTAKRIAPVRVQCPAASTGPCTGTLALTARMRTSKKSKKLVLRTVGSARLLVQPGATATVKVKLTKSSFAALRKSGKLRASAAATATDTVGPQRTTTRAITLLPPKLRR